MTQTIKIYIQDVEMKLGIEKCAMLIVNSGKRQKVEGIKLPSQESTKEKENYKYLGILEVDTKQAEMKKKKKKKRVPQKNEEASWNQALQQKFHQRDKHLGYPSCKILGTIPKMDKGGSQTNGPSDKKYWWLCTRLFIQEMT